MKVVIDIDERAYKGCVKLKSNDDMGVLGFHLINATANGTPLSEELEKLRTELHETAEMHSNGNYYLRDEWIDEYIDNHISELKGE